MQKTQSAEQRSLAKKVTVLRISKDRCSHAQVEVVREVPLTIFLNDREIVTLLCTGSHVESLAVGFLRSEGLLQERSSLKSLVVDENRQAVRV